MRKQISYTEPIPQFDKQGGRLPDSLERFAVIAGSQEEFDAHMTAITDPTRGITDVVVEEADVAGDEPPSVEELKAQIELLWERIRELEE